MSFGISHDTAEFSCDNFKYYWNSVLQGIYSHATTFMQLCDVEVATAVPVGFSSKD